MTTAINEAMLVSTNILVLDALKFLTGSGTPVGEAEIHALISFKAGVHLTPVELREELSALHSMGLIDIFVPLTQAAGCQAKSGCCGDAGGCCGGGCCSSACCGGSGCGRYYRVKIGSLV